MKPTKELLIVCYGLKTHLTQHLQKELDRGTSHNGQMQFQTTSLYERNCSFLFWVLNMFFLSLWGLVSSFETGKQEPRRLSHLVLYRNDERDKPSAAGKQSTEDGRRGDSIDTFMCAWMACGVHADHLQPHWQVRQSRGSSGRLGESERNNKKGARPLSHAHPLWK